MNLKRAFGVAFLSYFASFAAGFLVAMAFGIDLSTETDVPAEVWYTGILISVFLMALFTMWYFKGKGTKANARNGFYFGLVAIGLAFLLDAIVIIPAVFVTDAPSEVLSYYVDPLFWLSVLAVIVTTTATGAFLSRK